MSDLVEFLLARIEEDEEIARRSQADELAMGWTPGSRTSEMWAVSAPGCIGVMSDGARVLAECEAKRRIVRAATEVDADKDYGYVDELDDGQVWAFGVALQALALPYADHPDYREEWRP